MSFSGDVKSELCRTPLNRPCCARAEAYGALLYCSSFTASEVRLVTECPPFAQRLPVLLNRAFGLSFDRTPAPGEQKYVFLIENEHKLSQIMDTLGFGPRQSVALHINFGILEENCCRAAFLRGAFLAGGSVTEPVKRYHLELNTSHARVGRELTALLRELGLEPKLLTRGASQVTYFKSSQQIEDVLTIMGAPVSAMALMNAKAEKELRNGVNRRVNCENANLDKAVDAAQEQLAAIRRLYELGRVEALPGSLKETIVLREAYPELTLSELANEFDPPITKSCLNHRLRRLISLSRE